MKRENLKELMSNIISMAGGYLQTKGNANNTGTEVLNLSEWKEKCQDYFNRHYKAENIVTIPGDKDIIVETLTGLCSRNNGRGFVFKSYDMISHLEFLRYKKGYIKRTLDANLQDNITSYLAYIEQSNLILICENMVSGRIKKDFTSVKCFLALYIDAIKSSNVKIVGLLIR